MDIKQTAIEIQKGNEQAFKAFYDAYFGRIYSFLLTILHNPQDAEDVTSIAFIYVWDNRGKLRQPSLLVSWLYQIAKHRAFDYRRKYLNAGRVDLEEIEDILASDASSPEDFADQFFKGRLAEDLLSGLRDDERALLHLRFAEDLDFRAIAERLGSNAIAVRVRMHRIIKKLQKETGEDPESKKSFWKETVL